MSIVEADMYGQSDIAFVVHIRQTPDHPGAGAWYYTLECEHLYLHIESEVFEQDQGPYPSALAAAAAGKTAAIRKCAAHNVEAALISPRGTPPLRYSPTRARWPTPYFESLFKSVSK